jgi:phosphoribosylaminoimidazolecarboxamide formyltransferase / IMP cyclohydrolase
MSARLVVLVSGEGTNLQALIDAAQRAEYGARVVAVGSDRPGIGALDRAESHGIPTFTVVTRDYPTRTDWDEALTAECRRYQPDLIVLAGFMKLVGKPFLRAFGGRCVNTHPALLPSFPGTHGVRDALEHGAKVSGCTVLIVDDGVDTGPIVAQAAVPVHDEDDEKTLHERIKVAERVLLTQTVGRMVREGWSVAARKVRIGVSEASGAKRPARERTGNVPIRRALISVYDKAGLDELARGLHGAGVEIVSTGSTAATIAASGVPVTKVEDLTGFPECLDGRVKTLHPKVHAGLLADTWNPDHNQQLESLGIEPFQLLVANLYPFEATVASGASPRECVEQIDIGGPAMVRAAAKNHASIAVITDPVRYPDVLAAAAGGGFTLDQRRRLAADAYAHTAAYDIAVSSWFASAYAPDEVAGDTGWPAMAAAYWRRASVLRYGENPHQRAALYVAGSARGGAAAQVPGIASAELLHGKQMSYNNYVDADSARRAAYDFTEPCVAIIKHANPCGIAIGTDLADAHAKANACDPASAYGAVIAANGTVTARMAGQIIEGFAEAVIAPDFEPEATAILSGKWKNVRLLRCAAPSREAGVEARPISGGTLLQTTDLVSEPGDDPANWELKTGSPASPAQLSDLAFAWQACRSVKSNAILLASGGASVGVGMGQVNRVDSARLAVARAGERAAGSVAASDAFFPFPDALQILIDAGVSAVAEPGGSIRDNLAIEAAEAAGLTLYFTGVRHFYH